MPQRRSRAVTVLVVVAVLIAGLGAAGGGYLLLRTKGSPQQTAATYLRAWQQGHYRVMDQVSVNVPRSGLVGPLTQTSAELGIRSTRLSLGRVIIDGGAAMARFTAIDDLTGGHVWTY